MTRTARLVTLLATALSFLALPTHANASLSVRYRHFHFNMAGGAMNKGENLVSAAILNSVADWRPHIVTLNEVCYSQFAYLNEYMGYYGRFTTTSPDDRQCTIGDDKRYGNAIFITNVDSIVYTAYEHLLDQVDLSTPERRKLTCIGATISGGHLYVCNTHIHPHGDGQPQITQVAQIMNGTYGPTGKAIVLAGDFNSDIRDCGSTEGSDLAPIYRSAYGGTGTTPCFLGNSTFSEVDRWRSNGSHGAINETTHPGSGDKLDYIFFNHSHFLVDWSGDATSTQHSDHLPLRGEYTLVQ